VSANASTALTVLVQFEARHRKPSVFVDTTDDDVDIEVIGAVKMPQGV